LATVKQLSSQPSPQLQVKEVSKYSKSYVISSLFHLGLKFFLVMLTRLVHSGPHGSAYLSYTGRPQCAEWCACLLLRCCWYSLLLYKQWTWFDLIQLLHEDGLIEPGIEELHW